MKNFNILKIFILGLIVYHGSVMTSFYADPAFAYPTVNELQIFVQVARRSSNNRMHNLMVKKMQQKQKDLDNPIAAFIKQSLLEKDSRLIRYEADFLLTSIIKQGDTIALEKFLNMKKCEFFDINKPFMFFEAKVTPLYLAVYYKKIGIIKMLIDSENNYEYLNKLMNETMHLWSLVENKYVD